MKAAVLTVSDRAAAGVYEDRSGPVAAEFLRAKLHVEEVVTAIVPDDREEVERALLQWVEVGGVRLVLTSGGTGISPRDVTPQATRNVLDYEVPGLAELMRAASFLKTPMAALSRATAGVRGRTLIINLPGSPKAVEECLEAILPVLPHAMSQLEGYGH
ncbi:MAG TPA: MogA/MoaB family molybdenum cofactor biosynthesis protein [Chloroflexia bacterium]|nr:MogA/MoaB family molybdenum cofactor biosynthesis protein [Chloroflexia bacterium]